MIHPDAEPKVYEFNLDLSLTVLTNEYIIQLNIPMKYIIGMEMCQSHHNLFHDELDFLLRGLSVASILQVLAKTDLPAIFHNKVYVLSMCEVGIQLDDVLMVN